MESQTHQRKIVVVDDTPDNLALVEEAMKSEGFEVHCATSGAQGMEIGHHEFRSLRGL